MKIIMFKIKQMKWRDRVRLGFLLYGSELISISLICFRLSFAGIFVLLNFPVEYIFGSLIIDYFVKGILFTYRFESERWIKI